MLLIRGLELVGFVLVAIFVPRLARATGADPARALWLTALSPLVLLQLVAAGHNDLLMIGVMVAGVTLGARRAAPAGRSRVCTLAATIKIPAIAAVIFVAFAWARLEPNWPGGSGGARKAVVVAAAVAAGGHGHHRIRDRMGVEHAVLDAGPRAARDHAGD